MPRTNQFFDNLSEEELLNERDAVQVLEEYCEDNNIPLWSLPSSVISNFIETVRYAPHTIETDEIARRVGIQARPNGERNIGIPTNPSNYYYFNHNHSDVYADLAITQQTTEQPQARVAQSISRPLDFAELLQSDNMENILTAQIRPATIDSVEAMTPISEPEIDADFYTFTTARYTPKKKKRARSEMDMVKEIVRTENFPRPNFRDLSNDELDELNHDWCVNVDYREQWIFSRREREGFNRRNIGFFSLDDVMARMSKRKRPHHLDTETSKFYDWKLGGTEWILRLELYQHEQYYFLITRHIHKPTETEIKFDVRYWTQGKFKLINSVWCQQKNNDIQFDRVFGSNDENSPYYVRPYEEDSDYDEDYYDEEDYDNDEECEDSHY